MNKTPSNVLARNSPMIQMVRASSLKGVLPPLPGAYAFIDWKDSMGVAITSVSWPVFVQAVDCMIVLRSCTSPRTALGISSMDRPMGTAAVVNLAIPVRGI